ncbi:MAG: hypothetical protein LRY72_17025 [Saccharospirillaceae bacterium]|nr:hypothetical protein [Saccharospirillaceae bacterium]
MKIINHHSLSRILFCMYLFAANVPLASAQSKADVDSFFEKMASQMTAEREKHSNDIVQLIEVQYDPNRTELSSTYFTDSLASNTSDREERIVLAKTFLTSSACSLAPFMRVHNLRVIYTYYDRASRREVLNHVVTKRDCKN